jgi:dihydrouridine synthase duS
MTSFWNDLPQPFFVLAPMEAVTDVVFRHVVERAGAPDVFFTEFANATGWVHAGDRAIAGRLVKTDDEYPLVAQIWGGEPGDMEQFAQHCARLGFAGIDINMGCPAKSAIKSGGAALIRNPDVAVAAIAAAKTAGLPVSVKTRLGYSAVDEWRAWLTTLLQQNIVNLTVHLRTKKEMSKVAAHYELIDDIVALRDAIAPQTLLTINGDIRDRAHGMALVAAHPGVNGVMIGRGVFADPFCFAPCTPRADSAAQGSSSMAQRNFTLLRYHLDLFDRWQPRLGRPYETLKRFYKIYIRDFDGAKELRDQLMHTTSTDEARQIIHQWHEAMSASE